MGRSALVLLIQLRCPILNQPPGQVTILAEGTAPHILHVVTTLQWSASRPSRFTSEVGICMGSTALSASATARSVPSSNQAISANDQYSTRPEMSETLNEITSDRSS
jgi:hypothetical protein